MKCSHFLDDPLVWTPEVPGARDRERPGRLKVLISAYACEPGKGSEPGIGWNIAVQAACWHDVWVLTRANNRSVIEEELARNPMPTLHMIYHDLPRWTRWWKRGSYGTRVYYYLWQLTAYPLVRRLHQEIRFDVTHHATFVKYWMPSLLALLPAPFLWGPVGGGEETPGSFVVDCGWRARLHETVRSVARWCGDRDPLVQATARRSRLALAATPETARRVRAIGARHVEILSQLGLTPAERAILADLECPRPATGEPIRFLSLGNLLHWKGFHLGLRAFAAARPAGTEYWLVGDGPFRRQLQQLAHRLGIADQVRFWGALSRVEALSKLSLCHVLVHPSLHDSGALVCTEAMAAGKPVICLDLGGPGQQVTESTGYKIAARNPGRVIEEMAAAMLALAGDPELRARMGQAGRERVAAAYAWEKKGELVCGLYRWIAESPARARRISGDARG